jgi:hypothetical protein
VIASRAGYDLVKRDFNSPLPEIDDLKLWDGPAELPGVDLRLNDSWRLLSDLATPIAEFHQERDFRIDNGTYESVDAETLYAILGHFKPRRVVELGSGSSTLVIKLAQARTPFELHTFDPYPRAGDVIPLRAQDVPLEHFTDLESGDVLFVDTTHTVKTGGDVTRIVLDILPRLARGVLVHFHDIFLPYEYPRHVVVDERRAWAEQYLLHAFLALNEEVSVILAAHAMARADPERLGAAVPSFGPKVNPGAFWIRR